MIDVLHKGRGAEGVGLVENLVADRAAARQSGFGEPHAEPRHLCLRHQHRRAVGAELIGNSLRVELLGDAPGIVERELGEERRHRRLREAHDDEGEEADQDRRGCAHGGDARRSQRFDELDKTIHVGIPPAGRLAAMARFGARQ